MGERRNRLCNSGTPDKYTRPLCSKSKGRVFFCPVNGLLELRQLQVSISRSTIWPFYRQKYQQGW